MSFSARHLELVAMYPHYRCQSCKDIPPMEFAETVHCWACREHGFGEYVGQCCGVATKIMEWKKPPDDPSWQRWYHLCDEHAANWLYDKDGEPQKQMMRDRGFVVVVEPDGGWSAHKLDGEVLS